MTVRFLALLSIVFALLPASTFAQTSTPNTLFSDTFNRTSGLGNEWQVAYGSFSTDGVYAISGTPPANGNWASLVPSLGTDDYAVSADIIIPLHSYDSGVVARSSDPTSFTSTLYSAQIAVDGTVNLYRRNAWTWTLLSTVQAGIVVNVQYTVKLAVSGNNPVHLEVWLNGTQQISYDDTSTSRVTSGICGLVNYDPSVKYTNFIVTSTPRLVFSDEFARTSGLGSGWSVAYGSFTTDGTYAVSGTPPSNGNWASVSQPMKSPDYVVSADLIIPAGSATSGVVARSSDPAVFTSTLYAAQLSAAGSVNLYRRNNWTWTLLQSKNAGITANIQYHLVLGVSGSAPVHLDVVVNGTPTLSYDDNSSSRIISGSAGIENYSAGVKYAHFAVDAISPWPSGGDVVWTHQVNTTTSGVTISRSGGQPPADDAGAVSRTSAASSDATLQYVVEDVSQARTIGFGRSQTWVNANSLDYSFRLNATTADIYEAGVFKATVQVAVRDDLRISIVSGAARYYRNGQVVYTSSSSPVFPLYVSASPVSAGSTVSATKLWLHPRSHQPVYEAGWLLVSLQGLGDGRVTSVPTGIDCPGTCGAAFIAGTTVSLSATAGATSLFVAWDGACSGAGQCSILVTHFTEAVVRANFSGEAAQKSAPCGSTGCGGSTFPDSTWYPYSKKSAFNRVVERSTHVDPNSQNVINRMILGDMVDPAYRRPDHMLIAQSGVTGWPTYWSTQADPLFTIDCAPGCSVNGQRIHIPGTAKVQQLDPTVLGNDRHMTIIDQAKLVDSADLQSLYEADLWHVTWPGAHYGDSVSSIAISQDGTRHLQATTSGYTSLDGDGRSLPNDDASGGQGVAARVGNIAGRVRLEELQEAIATRSYIPHALAIGVRCTSGHSYKPATTVGNAYGLACSDKSVGLSADNAPPMGGRLLLDIPLEDIDDPSKEYGFIPDWKKVFLRTLIVYGAIIMDTNNSSQHIFEWMLESDLQYIPSPPTYGTWYTWAQDLYNRGVPDMVSDSYYGPGYRGAWDTNSDNINWTNDVWLKLVLLQECASKPEGCP